MSKELVGETRLKKGSGGQEMERLPRSAHELVIAISHLKGDIHSRMPSCKQLPLRCLLSF